MDRIDKINKMQNRFGLITDQYLVNPVNPV